MCSGLLLTYFDDTLLWEVAVQTDEQLALRICAIAVIIRVSHGTSQRKNNCMLFRLTTLAGLHDPYVVCECVFTE